MCGLRGSRFLAAHSFGCSVGANRPHQVPVNFIFLKFSEKVDELAPLPSMGQWQVKYIKNTQIVAGLLLHRLG